MLLRGRGRWHGEPLPLPTPSRPPWGGASQPTCGPLREQHRLLCEAVRSLNSMSRASVHSDLGAHFGTPWQRPSTTQSLVLSSLAARVGAYGDRPAGFSPDFCLRELVKVKDLYSQEPSHLASYSYDKLRVAKGSVSPQPAVDLVPVAVAEQIRDFRKQILKSEEQLEYDRLAGRTVQPYWDPVLRDSKTKRRELFSALRQNNMLTFCVAPECFVGLFFVHKKNDMIRLIVDARSTNLKCQAPPRTSLGTIAALSEVDFSKGELAEIFGKKMLDDDQQQALMSQCGECVSIPFSGSCLDVQDGFHQFDMLCMASLFALDDPDLASEFGVEEAWDGHLQRMVQVLPCKKVFPCIRTLSMVFRGHSSFATQPSSGWWLKEFQVDCREQLGTNSLLHDLHQAPPSHRHM